MGVLLISSFAVNQPSSANASPSAAPALLAQAGPPADPPSDASSTSSTPTAAAPPPAAPSANTEHVAGIGSATVVVVHGKIVSVDRAKKLVTFAGPEGHQVTLKVHNPYNLAAAKPGEPFVAKFYEIVTIRKQRPGESIPSASLSEGVVSATPGQVPGAAASRSVQVVASIKAINKTKKTVDLVGPDGAEETVKVANPANLRRVKVGDNIVVTLTHVVAISLDKQTGSS
jgi:hypothetical protein